MTLGGYVGELPETRRAELENILRRRGRAARHFDPKIYNKFALDVMDRIWKYGVEYGLTTSSSAYSPELPIFFARVVAEKRGNAFATKLENDGFIVCFTEGFLIECFSSCLNMTMTPYIISYLQQSKVIGEEWRTSPAPAVFLASGSVSNMAHRPSLLPSDWQFRLAYNLCEIAVRFVARHEFRHIVGGHLYYKNKIGPVALHEYVKDNPEIEDNKSRHTLEMDADVFAFNRALEDATLMAQEGMLEQTIILSVIAIFSVYLCLDDGAIDRPAAETFLFTHPQALRRFNYMILTAEAFLQSVGSDAPIQAGRWRELGLELLMECLRARQHLTDRFPSKAQIDEQIYDTQYNDLLLSRWSRLRPILEPHLLGTASLAPAQREPA